MRSPCGPTVQHGVLPYNSLVHTVAHMRVYILMHAVMLHRARHTGVPPLSRYSRVLPVTPRQQWNIEGGYVHLNHVGTNTNTNTNTALNV